MNNPRKFIRAIQWAGSGVVSTLLIWNIVTGSWAIAPLLAAALWFWLPEHIQQWVTRRFWSRRVMELEVSEKRLRAELINANHQWLAWQLRAQEFERRLQVRGRTPAIPAVADAQILRELVQAGRKVVAMKYHPDREGSNDMMQRVNATVDAVLRK